MRHHKKVFHRNHQKRLWKTYRCKHPKSNPPQAIRNLPTSKVRTQKAPKAAEASEDRFGRLAPVLPRNAYERHQSGHFVPKCLREAPKCRFCSRNAPERPRSADFAPNRLGAPFLEGFGLCEPSGGRFLRSLACESPGGPSFWGNGSV